MDNVKAISILRNDPYIRETLERAEAIQLALDELSGTYNPSEHENRWNFVLDGSRSPTPKFGLPVIVKTNDEYYIAYYNEAGDWETSEGTVISYDDVVQWKFIDRG